MDSTTIIQSNSGNEWIFLILSLLLLTGLYFVQKYIYKLDQILSASAKPEEILRKKPWPLYAGISLGFLVFLYSLFSPHEIDLKSWGLFEILVFSLIILIVAGILLESIRYLGLKPGLIRSLIYLVLTGICFYAGFISGLLFVSLLALAVLIYFFSYFKKTLTIQ